MNRIIRNCILFILLVTVFSCVYIGIFKLSLAMLFILLIIFLLYGIFTGIGEVSILKIKKYEQKAVHFGLTKKDDFPILLFSLTTLSPTYLCIVLASSLPIYVYEIWLITVFPCIIMNCLPACSVLEEYYGLTHRKLPFLFWFCILTVVFCFVGAIINFLLFKSLY